MKTFLGIGNKVNRKLGMVTGLAMMHELTLSVAKMGGYRVTSIDLNSRFEKKGSKIAAPGIKRFMDYILIFAESLWYMLIYRNSIVYINPATTKFGLKRDSLLVKMAKKLGHTILFQQFGAVFTSFYNSLSDSERKQLEYTYNAVDKIIVEGDFAKNQYPFIKDSSKIVVVNNGLPESDCTKEKTAKKYSKDDSFRLFFMNNMIESKGYIDVLEAVNILINKRNLPIECVFAGRFLKVPDDHIFENPDDAKKWFDNYIIEHNLNKGVTYHNSVFGPEKASLFLKSHAFLLPSYYIYEGQPTAILEALSYGCVPIVTKYRLITDMVDDTCGKFVEPQSPDSIADAIEYLIKNPEKYEELSTCGIKRFKEKFTREKYAKRMISILNDLSNGK